MRAVLMSMKPEWWEKILSREKTLEIRKSAPQSKDGRTFRWPLTVLVYVSGTGAVQGQFTCPGWIKTNLPEMLVERSGVKLEDLRTYAKGGSLYGWLVENPKKYYTLHTLEDFRVKKPPISWKYVDIPF